MLAEWLEKEAQGDLTKTAAQQFEAELAALDAPSIAKIWREAKEKEAAVIPGALAGAGAGALGGGLYGGVGGGIGGALAAQSGQRSEGFWQGAQRGAVPGALTGAALGGIGGAALGHAARTGRDQDVLASMPFLYGASPAGGLAGGVAGYAGEKRQQREKGKKSKEKKSSVDILRLALMKQAKEKKRDWVVPAAVGAGALGAGALGATLLTRGRAGRRAASSGLDELNKARAAAVRSETSRAERREFRRRLDRALRRKGPGGRW